MAVYSKHKDTPSLDKHSKNNRKSEIEDTAVRSQLTLSELEKRPKNIEGSSAFISRNCRSRMRVHQWWNKNHKIMNFTTKKLSRVRKLGQTLIWSKKVSSSTRPLKILRPLHCHHHLCALWPTTFIPHNSNKKFGVLKICWRQHSEIESCCVGHTRNLG